MQDFHLDAHEHTRLRLTQLSPHSYQLTLSDGQGERHQKGYMEVSGLNWLPRAAWEGFQGKDYLVHDAEEPGKSFVRWVAPIPTPGRYEVAFSQPDYPDWADYLKAKGVTYEIRSAERIRTRVLDQGSAGWTSLGTFRFNDRAEVIVRATGSGRVVADALRITPVGGTQGESIKVDRALAGRLLSTIKNGLSRAFGEKVRWSPPSFVGIVNGLRSCLKINFPILHVR